MHSSDDAPRTIVPSFVVQEDGKHQVLVFLSIPELRVKRSFPNILKSIPSNGYVKVLDFKDQAFTFILHVQNKVYSMVIDRLPGEIQPKRCSIKFKHKGAWITLFKEEPTSWMNRICDDLNPGLDAREEESEYPFPSAPPPQIQLKDSSMPVPFSLVPLAPPPPVRSSTTTKKAPAPPPPYPHK